MDMEEIRDLEIIRELLETRQYTNLRQKVAEMNTADVAAILEEMEEEELLKVFRILPKSMAADVFSYLEVDHQQMIITSLSDKEAANIIDNLMADDATDLLEEMPANVVDRLLMATDEEKRKQINQLLQYPEDSAGSIMNVDYIALSQDMTVEDAILKIRQVGLNRETIYTCYVTEKRKLIGVVDIKDLLTTGEARLIEEIMDTNMLYARTTDDQEDVARTITGITICFATSPAPPAVPSVAIPLDGSQPSFTVNR